LGEGDPAGLEIANRLLMAVLEIIGVQAEVRDCPRPLLAGPPISAQHPAHVEQQQLNAPGHPTSTAPARAPSTPTRRSGRQRSSYGPAAGAERSSPSTITIPRSNNVRCVLW